MKILLIEDDRLLIDYYKDILENLGGFRVEVVDWLFKAQKFLKEVQEGKREKPDLVLLDVVMPDKDITALDIVKMIKSHPETKDIRVFVFTNFGKEDMYENYLTEGAERIIIKSRYDPKRLILLLRAVEKEVH